MSSLMISVAGGDFSFDLGAVTHVDSAAVALLLFFGVRTLTLGVYKALHVLYAEPAFADHWIRMPNTNALFGGRPPIAYLADAGLDGLFHLRRLLDSRRG